MKTPNSYKTVRVCSHTPTQEKQIQIKEIS